MDRRAAMSEIYADDINAYMGLEYSHMGYWVDGNVDDFPTAQEEYLQQLFASLQLEPSDKVLDVGGGQAGTAIWLANHYGVEVVVVDIVEEMVEIGRERVASAGLSHLISCHVSDFLEFETDTEFDAIVAVESIYHMHEPEKVFKRFKHFLGDGCPFAISTYVSELRQGWLKDQYLMLTVGDRGIPGEADYVAATRAAGIAIEEVRDVTSQVLPGSTERLSREPYLAKLREYHVLHFGRIVGMLLPIFLKIHDWVMKRDGLRLLFVTGRT